MLPLFFIAALYPLVSFDAPAGEGKPLTAVSRVDLSRYVGKWHEIARLPNRFQSGCDHSTAEYSLRDDGKVRVVNTCRKENGEIDQAEGVAEVVEPGSQASQAKLKVSFLPGWLRWTGIGKGDYWIIDLAPDYSYAVVSEPKRQYLWILSRRSALSRREYEGILDRLRTQGFDLSQLIVSGKILDELG
ncbi:MAG TPA: lipocalin family protein [Bdellovibrionota bacterium]|nr:lipocalin family protein [Bdellovibrionota bacterium]